MVVETQIYMLWSLNMSTFTLHRGAINCKTRILFPAAQPLDDLQGPSDFHGHGRWHVCKAVMGYRC